MMEVSLFQTKQDSVKYICYTLDLMRPVKELEPILRGFLRLRAGG